MISNRVVLVSVMSARTFHAEIGWVFQNEAVRRCWPASAMTPAYVVGMMDQLRSCGAATDAVSFVSWQLDYDNTGKTVEFNPLRLILRLAHVVQQQGAKEGCGSYFKITHRWCSPGSVSGRLETQHHPHICGCRVCRFEGPAFQPDELPFP